MFAPLCDEFPDRRPTHDCMDIPRGIDHSVLCPERHDLIYVAIACCLQPGRICCKQFSPRLMERY
ncbi:MAG: hypothetical protein PVI86_01510 [Phycisphaerae bacterium]